MNSRGPRRTGSTLLWPPAAAPRLTQPPAAQRLDPAQAPAELRHIVPLAERWGIGDDVERNEKVDAATPADREELRNALQPVHDRITEWLDSLGQRAMTDEAAAFMYMQLALEEMTAGGGG